MGWARWGGQEYQQCNRRRSGRLDGPPDAPEELGQQQWQHHILLQHALGLAQAGHVLPLHARAGVHHIPAQQGASGQDPTVTIRT